MIGMIRPASFVLMNRLSSPALLRAAFTVAPGPPPIPLLAVVDNPGMRLVDPEILEDIGLGLYERKALMALMLCGVADAATLCREGDVPSSKMYQAMEKLAGLGLVQIQPTRP